MFGHVVANSDIDHVMLMSTGDKSPMRDSTLVSPGNESWPVVANGDFAYAVDRRRVPHGRGRSTKVVQPDMDSAPGLPSHPPLQPRHFPEAGSRFYKSGDSLLTLAKPSMY